MAEHVEVNSDGLFIDGRVFPWLVAVEDFEVHANPHEMPSVRMTVFTEHVTLGGPMGRRYSPRFRPLDITAERARLDDLGRRIADTRRCRTAEARP